MSKNRLTEQEELELYRDVKKIEAIGRQMIREIRAENKAMGVPIVFCREGTIYYELPDGTITQEPPPGFGNYQPQKPPPIAV